MKKIKTINKPTSLWKALLLEKRLPWRYKNYLSKKISKLTGKHFVFCRYGNKKLLKFKLNNKDFSESLFEEIFIHKIYFPNNHFKINKNDIVIDIGANIGLFSIFAANLSKKGKVYCFEPIYKNFLRLKNHKKINKLKNLILINKGVSDKNKRLRLYIDNDNCGAHSSYKKKKNYENVSCISLEYIFDTFKINRCNYLKIDCEGEEYKILIILPNKYFRKIEKIGMEYHINVNLSKLIKHLKKQGFEIIIKEYTKTRGMLFAFKTYNDSNKDSFN